ncbi:MAG: AI-2E family transporter [Firmicutes bacterium]|nr:AI-2E family transporter [Bacillota bacterium]
MQEPKERKLKLTKNQLTWGLTALIVVCLGILFFFVVYRWHGVSGGIDRIHRILQPFLVGAILAWLNVPLYNLCEKFFLPRLSKSNPRRGRRLTKLFCTVICLVFICGILYASFSMIVPGLVQSVSTLVSKSQTYLDTIMSWGEKFLENNPVVSELYANYSETIVNAVTSYAKNTILPGLTSLIGSVSVQIFAIFRFLLNFVIGIIVCVYVLNAKKLLAAQSKRLAYSVFGAEKGNTALDVTRFIDRIFYGYISGKLWDSLIIGVICFIGCTIMQIPYSLLVSVVIGITNIIPTVGPFIGAIPSALLILVESPVKCLYFVIFIIVLQQVDGNIIGPKILGESVGLSPLWILFSILVFGGFFGFWGMLLGVPFFTCLYTLLRWLIRRALAKKELPTETDDYDGLERIDPETKAVVLTEPKPKKRTKPEGGLFRKKKKDADAEEPPEPKNE